MSNPMSMPEVVVVILGYNDRRHLETALSSVLAQDYAAYRVMFVDGASTDDSAEFVRARFPNVELVVLQHNLGYAGAYSQVLAQVLDDRCDAAVLLNADVEVGRTWLSGLVRSAFSNDRIGFAQPKIYLWDSRTINSFGNRVNYLGFGYCGLYGQSDGDLTSRDVESATVSGACLLVKRQAYWDVGGLDASFFAYVEDQDLVWRGRMRGWRAVASAESTMRHNYRFLDPARSSRKVYLYERNRLRFVLKNYGPLLLVSIVPAYLVMEAGLLCHALLNGYFLQKCRAYRDVVLELPVLFASRRAVQRARTVHDQDLVRLMSPTIEFPDLGSGLAMRAANALLSVYFRIVCAVML